jgi:hypothetical protein
MNGDAVHSYGGFVTLLPDLAPFLQPLTPADFYLRLDRFVRGKPDPAGIAVKRDHSTVSYM